jgi:hypothetical protein
MAGWSRDCRFVRAVVFHHFYHKLCERSGDIWKVSRPLSTHSATVLNNQVLVCFTNSSEVTDLD